MKLTPKQKKFCEYYAQSGNATESAAKAGYSKKTARVIGQENLLKPALQKYIKELTKKEEESRIMSIEESREWLTKVIKGEIKEIDMMWIDGELTEVEREPRIDTRIRANDQLIRSGGGYLDKVELRLPQNSRINEIEEYMNGRKSNRE